MSYSLSYEASVKTDFATKTWQLFLLILIANLVVSWCFNEAVFTREVYYNILSERLDTSRIDEYFDFSRKLTVWGYIAQPLLFGLQLVFFAFLLQMPLLLMLIEIPFSQLFRILTISSLTATAFNVVKLLYLLFHDSTEITREALDFMPLSLAAIGNLSVLSKTISFLLGKLNFFEVAWCFMLGKGLIDTGKISIAKAIGVVFSFWTALLLFQLGIVAYFDGITS